MSTTVVSNEARISVSRQHYKTTNNIYLFQPPRNLLQFGIYLVTPGLPLVRWRRHLLRNIVTMCQRCWQFIVYWIWNCFTMVPIILSRPFRRTQTVFKPTWLRRPESGIAGRNSTTGSCRSPSFGTSIIASPSQKKTSSLSMNHHLADVWPIFKDWPTPTQTSNSAAWFRIFVVRLSTGLFWTKWRIQINACFRPFRRPYPLLSTMVLFLI